MGSDGWWCLRWGGELDAKDTARMMAVVAPRDALSGWW